jgi:hypothetical protein
MIKRLDSEESQIETKLAVGCSLVELKQFKKELEKRKMTELDSER